jgi:hypothetical protein
MQTSIDANDVIESLGELVKQLSIENAKLVARLKQLERNGNAAEPNS